MSTPRDTLAAFVRKCRAVGVKATHQRTEVLRELAATDEHPDAETIHRRVRDRLPTISLDTVYRTLRLFEEKGVISRVGSMRDRARFDANSDNHHHFVCTECGLVRDFYSDDLDAVAAPPEIQQVGSVNRVYVELRGRCHKCQEESG